ncbi:MAG: FtsX-like permease family protein, partial [Bacteroidota bacterium]
ETNPSNDWGSSSPRTYVLLKEGAMLNQFNTKIWDFIKTKDANSESTLFAQRYSDRYLYGSYENGMPSGGRIAYVRLFSIIAVFILAIACVNFMNLSTAKASRRLKEIGIKKAIGANRKSLIFQYLEESTLMSFLSLALAILLLLLLLPQFNQITGKQLALRLDSRLILSVLGITLFTGIIAGSYPAFYLSAFQPVAVLKGKLSTLLSGEGLRKGLVIFQFALSVMLIASVFIVYQQIELIQSKNLGYERDHILYFDTENMSNAFISEIENIPEVLQVGGGSLTAGSPLGGTNGIEWEGKSPDDNIFFSVKWVSYGLIETLGMEMVKGRSFLEDFGSPNQIIFNEKAMEAMGLTDPIGKSV